jgi:RimJ/RimL family protein N-acetyltransferase
MQVELRHWQVDDAPALARAVHESLDHLRPWMPWAADEPKPASLRAEQIREWERERLTGGDEVLGIFVDGQLAGGSGLHRRIGDDGLELGYWVHVGCTRRGVATEVVRQLCARAFADPAVDRVEIHHDRANAASGAVAAKSGFTLVEENERPRRAPNDEGVERVWRLTRADYEARAAT